MGTRILTIHTLTGAEAAYDPTKSRLGVIVIPRQALLTIERPWLPNPKAPDGKGAGTPNKSCVPIGEYDLVLSNSPSEGMQWHLLNPDLGVFVSPQDCTESWHRWGCMFHPANYVYQLEGCIAPGLGLGDINGDGVIDVESSRAALVKIKGYLEGETTAKLRIA